MSRLPSTLWASTLQASTPRPLAFTTFQFSTLNSQFSIYPNPTSGKVTITSPAPLVSATVTDMMGHQVYTKTVKQSNIVYRTDGTPQAITINLSHLPQGAYFLTLTTASGKSHTLKLIKK